MDYTRYKQICLDFTHFPCRNFVKPRLKWRSTNEVWNRHKKIKYHMEKYIRNYTVECFCLFRVLFVFLPLSWYSVTVYVFPSVPYFLFHSTLLSPLSTLTWALFTITTQSVNRIRVTKIKAIYTYDVYSTCNSNANKFFFLFRSPNQTNDNFLCKHGKIVRHRHTYVFSSSFV